MKAYDVAIVGAGPAGLFAALELSGRGLRVALIDKGLRAKHRKCPVSGPKRVKVGECVRCSPCHILYGVGGAGTLSSGIINLRPDVGGDLHTLVGSWEEAENLIKYVDSMFVRFGAPKNSLHIPRKEEIVRFERLAAKAGAKLIPTPQRVLGTENTVKVIENMTNYLESKGVRVATRVEVTRITREGGLFKLATNTGFFMARYVVLAPGRGGSKWFLSVAKELEIDVVSGPLDVGVRLEMPSYVAEELTEVVRDPKIIMYTMSHDDKVRTFCVNPNGYVVLERYDDGLMGVNGESYASIKSGNTNMALLVTIELTDPYEDASSYGRRIASLANRLGGGKPIIQRLGDLQAGRRSTWPRIMKSPVVPTLKAVTPGDIGMALPYRVVDDILEALERLDTVIPGIASQQTLLYTPEVKFYSVKAKVTQDLQTNIENLYAAGDGVGLSRGINVAAATGIIAARGIMKKAGIEPHNTAIEEHPIPA
ncbi:MAG: NAD(P)/FAD-dependent oxidoreductase [Desulfurococcales archaeon]|nr:NAD(P)/FAD-dependent oxidoreductase [Desulfurococcales archaeon]